MFDTGLSSYKYWVFALFLLTFIVIERFLYSAAQHEECNDVNDCHATHGDISKCPGNVHGVQCTNKYHHYAAATEEEQCHFVISDKTNVEFCIEVVTNQRGECEQQRW